MKPRAFPAFALLLSLLLGGCIPTALQEGEETPELDAGDDTGDRLDTDLPDTEFNELPSEGEPDVPDVDCADEECLLGEACFSTSDCAGPLVEAVSGCQRSESSNPCDFFEEFTVTVLFCDRPPNSTSPGTCQVEAQTSDSRPCRPAPAAVISAHESCSISCATAGEEPLVGRCIFQGPNAGTCDCQQCFIHSDCTGDSQCCGENQCFTADVSCLDLE